ncbi:hypothetical protein Tco_1470999, partial [Tanacetum coccineum]
KRIDMVPYEGNPQSPKPLVRIEEKFLKPLSLLKLKINAVKKDEGSRVDVKRKATEDKLLHEKMFEVDEVLDCDNSKASYF